MHRRQFLASGAASQAGAAAAAATLQGAVIELRYLRLRNNADNQMQRTSEFLEKWFLPSMTRAGAGPLGFFANLIGPDSPSIVYLVSYPSLAAMEAVSAKTAEDKEFQKALAAYYAQPGLGYMRTESSLLRAFNGMPAVEIPPLEARRAPRVFELRVYESDNFATLDRKIKMFEQGEIAIFRRLGMRPVFFTRTIVGPRMPNLAYLLAFDDLAAREKAWRAFGADPEWQKLRAQPGLGDAEIVSNISNSILRPLPFSPIR